MPRKPAPEDKTQKVKLTKVFLPEMLHRRLKSTAVLQGRRITDVIAELLDRHLPKP